MHNRFWRRGAAPLLPLFLTVVAVGALVASLIYNQQSRVYRSRAAGCSGIGYNLKPAPPEVPNSTVSVNINRTGATPCSGNWDYVGLKLDGVNQNIRLCYADGSNCSEGYHSIITSGAAGTHTLQFTVNNGACLCNSTTFQTQTTTTTAPSCTLLNMNVNSPVLGGASVTVRCHAGKVVNHANFRYQVNSGSWNTAYNQGGTNLSAFDYKFNANQAGTWRIQCQVCNSADQSNCSTWGVPSTCQQTLEVIFPSRTPSPTSSAACSAGYICASATDFSCQMGYVSKCMASINNACGDYKQCCTCVRSATPTRTPTPAGPSPTRTRTPTPILANYGCNTDGNCIAGAGNLTLERCRLECGLSGPTPTRTRTPTPGGPSPTRTRTPTPGRATATRTPTPRGPTPTRTRTPTPPLANYGCNTDGNCIAGAGNLTLERCRLECGLSGPTPTRTRTPTPGRATATRTPTPRGPTATRTPTPRAGTPTRTPTPGGPTATRTPTPAVGNAARLRFRLPLPDIASTTSNINAADVLVEVRDGATTADFTHINLVRTGNYYQTPSDASFSLSQNKTYSVFVKTHVSLGRLFTGVNLRQAQTLDCTVTTNSNCGELISQRNNKILASGDSDGFQTTSGSYNKVDSADLQVLAAHFNTPATGAGTAADFNLDGNVDIADLEILGKNYGQQGD